MPPTISLEQMTGFSLFMLKVVLSGRGDEIMGSGEGQSPSLATATTEIKRLSESNVRQPPGSIPGAIPTSPLRVGAATL